MKDVMKQKIFNWHGLSLENLKVAQKVIRITFNFLQLHGINRLTLTTRIPIRKFEGEQIYFEDVYAVLARINGIEIKNAELLNQIKEYQGRYLSNRVIMPGISVSNEGGLLPGYLPTKEELKNYVYLKISSLDDLHRVKNFLDNEAEKNNEQKLTFDDVKSILYFAGEEIIISKRAENDAHELLRIIFKDKAKIGNVWNNDEILDEWKVCLNKERIPKNKVYHAGKAVNRIIAQETKIKDFLIVTTKTIVINKKYLGN